MPEPLTTYIAFWHDKVATVALQIHYGADALQSAGIALQDGNYYYAGTCLISAHTWFENAFDYMGYASGCEKDRLYTTMNWIDVNWPTAPTVTMASILNAMLAAKFDELQKFIGIEDAYRCALWDAPFNIDFYAALARGFKKW